MKPLYSVSRTLGPTSWISQFNKVLMQSACYFLPGSRARGQEVVVSDEPFRPDWADAWSSAYLRAHDHHINTEFARAWQMCARLDMYDNRQVSGLTDISMSVP